MKTAADVAKARDAWFDELHDKVGRIAWGADRSERYAHELRDWLRAHHPDAPGIRPLIEALDGYRSKSGVVEVEQLARQALEQVRLGVEGPHLNWQSVPDAAEAEWRVRFSAQEAGIEVVGGCPVCGEPALRHYFRRYSDDETSATQRGGLWEWCSNCLAYEHFQAAVPDWWKGDANLDRVPLRVLEHSPEFLERELRYPSS